MRILIAYVLLAGAAIPAHSESILGLEERDLDNALHNVAIQPGIVDINSTITVKIDKAMLHENISSIYDQFPSEQLKAIESIQASIKDGLDALPAVQQALEDYISGGEPTQAEIDQYFESMKNAAAPAVKILTFAGQEPRLDALIDKGLQALPKRRARFEDHRVTFEAAAAYVTQIQREIDLLLTTQGVYVQLGGWLLHGGGVQPIHLPGFDMHKQGEFEEIERWRLTALLSEENKARFENAATTARKINQEEKSISDALSPMIPEALGVVFQSIETCAGQLKVPLTALDSAADTAAQNAQQLVDAARLSVQSYIEFIVELRDKYSDSDGLGADQLPNLFQQLAIDLKSLRERTKLLRTSVKELHADLNALKSTMSAQSRTSMNEMDTVLGDCKKITDKQVASLQGMIGILKNGREIATASLEYSDKVLKHDLDALPESVRFDLRTTGTRTAGDSIVLRISSGRPKEAVRHIEERYLRIYKVLTHVDVAVSLIFADPKDDFDLDTRFQAAPSYSVLLKSGTRDSIFKNELLQPGYGLNIAALDFDSDESLEIGVGFTVSVFRDYLQIGYGFNLSEDSEYWFLGLKFPLNPGTGAVATPP